MLSRADKMDSPAPNPGRHQKLGSASTQVQLPAHTVRGGGSSPASFWHLSQSARRAVPAAQRDQSRQHIRRSWLGIRVPRASASWAHSRLSQQNGLGAPARHASLSRSCRPTGTPRLQPSPGGCTLHRTVGRSSSSNCRRPDSRDDNNCIAE